MNKSIFLTNKLVEDCRFWKNKFRDLQKEFDIFKLGTVTHEEKLNEQITNFKDNIENLLTEKDKENG